MSQPAWTVTGQGSTAVLLLHGIGGGQAIWGDAASGTVSALAQAGYTAVAVDFPGYGQAAAQAPQDMPGMGAAVHQVIDSLRATQVVLLGHSMGGMVAQALCAASAGQEASLAPVRGLVLACTSASFGKADGNWQAQFIAERLAPLDAGLGMAGMAERLVPGLVSPGASPTALAMARDVMARVPESTYRTALRAIAGFDARAALAQLHLPTLLLAGEHDRTAPPEVMQRMAARLPFAEFLCLANVGHIANLEAPAAFNAAVLAWLRRHFPVA